MPTNVQNYLEEKILWKPGKDPLYPYQVEWEGEHCLLRLNDFPDDHLYTHDFPDDHLYTLIVNGNVIVHFDDWPQSWTRP